MKTQIISKIAGCFLSILSASISFSQEQSFKELPPITVTAATTNVSARVNNAFGKYFKDASHLRWYQVEKKILVKFIQNDQDNSALFAKNGSLIYHISYGSEKHLPADVRKIIKSTYYDYNITRVIKVNEDMRSIWVINLEDNKNLILVRVEDGEMEETKHYQKSL